MGCWSHNAEGALKVKALWPLLVMVLKATVTVVNQENIEEKPEAAGHCVGCAFWASYHLLPDFLNLALLPTHRFTKIPPYKLSS